MVAVSIVTFHVDEDELRRAVDSLADGCVSRIFIVDNAREERVEKLALELNCEYIPADNRGYGAGHNLAIRRTMQGGEAYHLVMNSDLQFSPADIRAIEEYMDAHPDVGALQPRIVGADGKDQYTVRQLPTPFDLILRRFLPKWMFRHRRDRYLLKHLDHSQEHDVHYMQGSFMFLRVDTLRDVGLFDERFFMYPEDIDLTRRIARRSRAVYWPGVVVKHLHRAESYRSMRMLWVHMSNMVRYFNKWGWVFDVERRRSLK